MNFESRITLTSQLPEFADVRFTLNKMTEGRRTKLRLAIAEVSVKIQEMSEQVRALAETEPGQALKLLQDIDSLTSDVLHPAILRWGLHSIENFTIDGVAPDADLMREEGPVALYKEMLQGIQDAAGMTARQQGESVQPSTYGAQVDGLLSTSSVPVAEETVTT